MCSAKMPQLLGLSHDCEGKRTAESCTLSADLGFTLTGQSTLSCQAWL